MSQQLLGANGAIYLRSADGKHQNGSVARGALAPATIVSAPPIVAAGDDVGATAPVGVLASRAFFDTEVTAPQANDLGRVLGVARVIAGEGTLPADALADFVGSRESTSYRNTLRAVYYYGDAARSLGLATRHTDSDGRTYYSPTAFAEDFFLSSEAEQCEALESLVGQYEMAEDYAAAEDGSSLADDTLERRAKTRESWCAARDEGFVGVLDEVCFDEGEISSARQAGQRRWEEFDSQRVRPEPAPVRRHGEVCQGCFVEMPVRGGECPNCT